MRHILIALTALPLFATAASAADIKVHAKVETYRIVGDSGVALMSAMDRNGPRHGFLARAIAQTRYSVNWELGWLKSGDDRCRLKTADVTLSVNYRYPDLSHSAPQSLQKKWVRFMVGVRKHEETHGRLALKMANEARGKVLRVAVDNDPSCRAAKREVTRIVQATYADYEARQQRFDALEHQPGGHVDRLVSVLIRNDRKK